MTRNPFRKLRVRKPPRPRPFRPVVENLYRLENRILLSTCLTVNNLTDAVNGDISSVPALCANPGGDGISLREAIEAANKTAGKERIEFSEGLAGGTITLGGTQLVIGDDLEISGLGADQLTVDGNLKSRVFRVNSGVTAEISGLLITGGWADFPNSGAGVGNEGTLTIRESTVSGNVAWNRAAGLDNSGTLNLINSTVSDNIARRDGGGGIRNVGTLTVIDSTISRNWTNGAGGGILNAGGTFILRRCKILANMAANGAGIQTGTGDVTIEGSTISENRAWVSGGGMHGTGAVAITNSTISWNSADKGAGIYIVGGVSGVSFTLARSTVSDNRAQGAGGGIFADNKLVVTESTIFRNSAENGAGINSSSVFDTVVVSNSALAENSAGRNGGGINNSGKLNVTNTMIAENAAQNDGGGILSRGGFSSATVTNSTIAGNRADSDDDGSGVGGGVNGQPTVRNTIVAGNRRGSGNAADDISGSIPRSTSKSNLIGDPNSAGGLRNGQNGNIVGANPKLGPLSDNGRPANTMMLLTMMPLAGSPAIDAGDNSLAVDPDGKPLPSDQRGEPRIVDGNDDGDARVDIGAVESAFPPLSLTNLPPTLDPIPSLIPMLHSTGEQIIQLTGISAGGQESQSLSVTAKSDNPQLVPDPQVTYTSPQMSGTLGFASVPGQAGRATITVKVIDAGPDGRQETDDDATTTESFTVDVYPSTFIVDTTEDAPDADPSDRQAKDALGRTSLRSAIQQANVLPFAQMIVFEPDVPARTITLNGKPLEIVDHLKIEGLGAARLAVSGYGQSSSVLVIEREVSAEIRGLKLTGATTNAVWNFGTLNITDSSISENTGGRGIRNDWTGTLNISNSTMSNNSTTDSYGGGIYNDGALTIIGSAISNNSSKGWGGGLYLHGDGRQIVTIADSTISNNSAPNGGSGILNWFNTVTITHTTIATNSRGSGGGGGIQNFSTMTISESAISGNSAIVGGGLSNWSTMLVTSSTISGNTSTGTSDIQGGGGIFNAGTLTLVDSTISENTSASLGGGIYNLGGTMTATNSTIAANRVESALPIGGGIMTIDSDDPGVTLLNTIVAGNFRGSESLADDIGGTVDTTSSKSNLIGDASSSGGLRDGVNGNIVGVDPMLGPLQDNGGPTQTMALPGGSRALDAADNSLLGPDGCSGTDQRGMPRCIDGDGSGTKIVDIGAFEFAPPSAVNDPPRASATPASLTINEDAQPGSITLSGLDLETGPADLKFTIIQAPDHGTLRMGTTTLAEGSTFVGSPSDVSYTPDSNFNGSDGFQFQVTDRGDPDNCGPPSTSCAAPQDSSVVTVSISVNPLNDQPSAIASPASLVINEDAPPTTVILSGSDFETAAGNLKFTITQAPAHGTLRSGTAVLVSGSTFTGSPTEMNYQPELKFNGRDSFRFHVSDRGDPDTCNDGPPACSPARESGEVEVSITVNTTNDAPVADAKALITDEDTPQAIILAGSDIDNATLTFIVVSGPSHGTVSPASGTMNCTTVPNATGTPGSTCTAAVTYTADPNYNGSDSFTYKVNDGSRDSDPPAPVTITVNAVNDAPVADAKTESVDEDTPETIILSASDIDSTSLTFTVVNGPSHGIVNPTSGVMICTTVPNGTGTPGSTCTTSVTYTPSADYNGPEGFTYLVSDGSLDSDPPAPVTITVNAVNDAPVADAKTESTDEDTPQTIILSGSDIDSTSLTFAVGSGPKHGTVSPTSGTMTCTPVPNETGTPGSTCTGSVTYTPSADYNGPEAFTYVASDGSLDSSPAQVTITVSPVNDRPVADAKMVITDEDTAKTITLSASDIDSIGLTFTIGKQPEHGTVTPTSGTMTCTGVPNDTGTPGATCTASVTYTPDANFNGSDSFMYTVTDLGDPCPPGLVCVALFTGLTSRPAPVFITINPVNDAPTASDGSASTPEGTDLTIDLRPLASDLETANANLSYVIDSGPSPGTLRPSSTKGVFTYSPPAKSKYVGADNFTYHVVDRGDSDNCGTEGVLPCDQALPSPGATFRIMVAPILPGGIKGLAFEDSDGNRFRDPGEPGLRNWVVFLDVDRDGKWDPRRQRKPAEPLTRTANDGTYEFANLTPGKQMVCLAPHPGWVATCTTPNVPNGGIVQDVNLWAYRPVKITGLVFHDKNGNARRDRREPSLRRWTVFLDADGDAVKDSNELSKQNSRSGTYTFSGLAPAMYQVCLVMQPGWRQTFPPDGACHTLTLRSGDRPTRADFGVAPQAIHAAQSVRTQSSALQAQDSTTVPAIVLRQVGRFQQDRTRVEAVDAALESWWG